MSAVKILGVMQNQWFKRPDVIKQMIAAAADQERYRRRLITHALFAGCRSGRVLRRVFGDLCDTIVWEEASREIGGHASSVFPPDVAHLRAVVESVSPDIIIAFGTIARDGLTQATDRRIVLAPHPVARGADTMDRLNAALREVQELIEAVEESRRHPPLGWDEGGVS